MKKIVALIRKALGLEATVDSIMAPLTKIVTKLEQHEQDQKELVAKQREAAEKAHQVADAAAVAASNAASKRAKMLETFA